MGEASEPRRVRDPANVILAATAITVIAVVGGSIVHGLSEEAKLERAARQGSSGGYPALLAKQMAPGADSLAAGRFKIRAMEENRPLGTLDLRTGKTTLVKDALRTR